MATIPIEIIIQDAESPVTPTSESGEETNITVPDTGTISDVSNSGGIASSASIILPAIIVVLAIGAIVAMLVHKHRKHQNDKLSTKEKFATAASSTIAILAATVLVGNLVIPATKAASDETNSNSNGDEGELVVEDKITITVTREADSGKAIVSSIENTSLATASYDFGYKVTASMAEGTTTANLYLDGNTDSPYYIAPVSDGILTDNTWGYTLTEPTEESSYLSIPLYTKPTNIVKEVAKTVEDTAVDIYYTVQIDKDMPNGTYTGELEYTIAPAIEYMQDFSTITSAEKTATLARMTESKQYILKDFRDKKPYYISKLADGNVWMTQNLDFDIVDGGTDINSTNTDVPEDWADGGELTNTCRDDTWDYSATTPNSYDPGDLYWNGALVYNQETCEANRGTWYDPGYRPAYCGGANPTTSAGNSHYHIGNYYDWTAAVAMNDSSPYTSQQDISQSICPAGWRLPAYNGNKSYENLVSAQVLTSGTDGNIQNNPVYFVYGGSWSGNSEDVGSNGQYWSSVVGNGYGAFLLWFTANNSSGSVSADSLGDRSHGLLLRCVAR